MNNLERSSFSEDKVTQGSHESANLEAGNSQIPSVFNQNSQNNVADLSTIGTPTEFYDSINQAEELPINLAGSTWTPNEEGDLKRVMFLGIKYFSFIPDGETEKITLPYVLFAEPVINKDGEPKINTILTARAVIRTFFFAEDQDGILQPQQPLKSIWKIEYTGVDLSGGKTLHTYAINPLQPKKLK